MWSALLLTALMTGGLFTVPGPPDKPADIYAFKVPALTGGSIDFKDFKGKKVLVVNTASKCGFTPQYSDLEKLYNRFKDKLVIVGFPCNNFGQQAPGTGKEISAFCTNTYHITFPMAAKVNVKGTDTAPIYQWLESQATAKGLSPAIPQWNFGKYLLDENGQLVAVFPSKTNPMSTEVMAAVNR